MAKRMPNSNIKIPNNTLSDIKFVFLIANPLRLSELPKNANKTKNNVVIIKTVNVNLFVITSHVIN